MGRNAKIGIGIAVASAICVAIPLLLSLRLSGPSERNFSVRAVLPIGDGSTLLFVERAGFDDATDERGRLRVVRRDGRELRRSKTMDRRLLVYGIVGEQAWIDSHTGGLESWRLSDLSPIPGARAAIEAHPMLSRKLVVKGLAGDSIVVQAADDALYTVSANYQIGKQPKGFSFHEGGWRPDRIDDDLPVAGKSSSSAQLGDERIALEKTELVHPAPLVGPDGKALVVAGEGALVYSIDFDGAGSSAIVSQIAAPSSVRWSLSMRDVIGPREHDLGKSAGYRLVSAELRDRVLWLVVEANVVHRLPPGQREGYGEGYGEYEIRLAEIDPSNGKPRTVQRIVRTKPP